MSANTSRATARDARVESTESTPVAVLGTLAEFHHEPIPYDLSALVRLVGECNPELLCLDLTPDQWRHRDFEDLPPEYRDALLPLAEQTDIVVVPVAGDWPPAEPAAIGWRGTCIGILRHCLILLQRGAPNPEAISEGPRHLGADLLYGAITWLAGRDARRAWCSHTEKIVDRVHEVARRDPGSRVLVAVNVRHCHHVRRALRKRPAINVASVRDL